MASNMEDNSTDSENHSKDTRPVLQPSVVTAFIAGVVLANFNKNLLMGFVVGGLVGAYAEQSFPKQFPNIKHLWRDIKRKWTESR